MNRSWPPRSTCSSFSLVALSKTATVIALHCDEKSRHIAVGVWSRKAPVATQVSVFPPESNTNIYPSLLDHNGMDHCSRTHKRQLQTTRGTLGSRALLFLQCCASTIYYTINSWELDGACVIVVGVLSLRRPNSFRGDFLVSLITP